MLFSHQHSEAERLRKQWEEEEEERLRQMSVPAEPKSKKRTHTRTHAQDPLIGKADLRISSILKPYMLLRSQLSAFCPLRVPPPRHGVPPGGGRPAVGLLPVSPRLCASKRPPEHAGKHTTDLFRIIGKVAGGWVGEPPEKNLFTSADEKPCF